MPGCPGTAFPILGQNADPPQEGCLGGWLRPAGLGKFFETFCMGVCRILGLGGSKYRPPPPGGSGSGWAGRPGPRSAWVGPRGSVLAPTYSALRFDIVGADKVKSQVI